MSNDTLTIKFSAYPGTNGSRIIQSSTYHVYVLDNNDNDAPEPDYEFVSVPGRTGDLTFWNGRYKNKQITYKCICDNNARTNVPSFFSALLAQPGQARLEDTLNTTYFKKGIYIGNTAPRFSDGGKRATFDITFNCQPQKWLFAGETETNCTAGTYTFANPSSFPSYPLFRIQKSSASSTGTITIKHLNASSDQFVLTDAYAHNTQYVYYDSETQDAYIPVFNLSINSTVTKTGSSGRICFQGGNSTRVTVAGGISNVYITPRYYIL